MTGFMEMYKNFQKNNLHPRFGLTRIFKNSIEEAGDNDWSKIVIFCKNTDGYKDLIKLHNYSNINNKGCVTPEILKLLWTKNLELVIPFYDSYIHRNVIYGSSCMPEFGGIDHTFFIEKNDLPFDDLIQSKIKDNRVLVKSIFYKEKKDFPAWLTYRCALNLNIKGKKRSLQNPMFEHCHSKEFSFESFKEYANRI
jgi:hypothetical protein